LETVEFKLLTDVCRAATLVAILESPDTDVIRPLTSLCRVVRLVVMEPMLACSVFTLFCRLATAELALVAAVAAALALSETVVREVDSPLTVVLIELREVWIEPRDVLILESELVTLLRLTDPMAT
jgi:hypothetical protein